MAEYVLQLLHGKSNAIVIGSPGVEGYILGRSDDAIQYSPDVDLATYEARERGVSRRHAALVLFSGAMHLVDLGSVNGTYINGVRLVPDHPSRISPGDELRLGMLELILLKQKD